MAVNVEANRKRRLRSFPNSSFKVLALRALEGVQFAAEALWFYSN